MAKQYNRSAQLSRQLAEIELEIQQAQEKLENLLKCARFAGLNFNNKRPSQLPRQWDFTYRQMKQELGLLKTKRNIILLQRQQI
jgi:hypothetical protein